LDWSLFAFGPTGWGDELLSGLWITLVVAVASYLIGVLAGFLFGLAELYAARPVASLFGFYGMVMRSVPELLVLFLIYYAAGFILNASFSLLGIATDIAVGPFAAGIIALSMVQGAYTSEVVKGAIRAVPQGLHEAASALGMSRSVAFFKITLPIALRYAFSGLANLWMVVLKNTPFVSAIGVADFIGQASTAGQNTKHYFAFFLAVLLVYLVISAVSMAAQMAGERRLFRHVPPPVT
jgi:His/Glu/Gln/Arg/opine family amino acid ABC transporter permease subunit